MKRKHVALLLTMALSMSLFACGTTESKDNNTSSVTEKEEQTSSNKELVSNDEAEDDVSESAKVSIVEQELFNQDGIIITATGYEEDGFIGPEIKLLIENNHEKNITVQIRNGSVNGYMQDLHLSCDVATGKKANDTISLSEASLALCDITTITDLEFSFHIFNSDSWDTILDSEQIKISTSGSESYEQVYDDSGEVLFDNNGIQIISKGILEDDSFLGPSLCLYIENNSENNIIVQSRDTSINGFMSDPVLSPHVLSGKRAIATMTFMSSDLEENDIEKIDEIETSFHIFNPETLNEIVDTEPILVSFAE